MTRATASMATGVSAVIKRRIKPQQTTAGPDCHTIRTTAGTLRSALSRFAQASRDLWRMAGLAVSITFQDRTRVRKTEHLLAAHRDKRNMKLSREQYRIESRRGACSRARIMPFPRKSQPKPDKTSARLQKSRWS